MRIPWLVVALLIGYFGASPGIAVASDRKNDDPDFVVVGYLPQYRLAKWSADQMGPVTDLVYFSLRLSHSGELLPDEVKPPALSKLRQIKEQTGCRLLISIGGGGRSDGIAVMATDAMKRAHFVDAIEQFCVQHGFDGVDFDWEYPKGQEQQDAYVRLLGDTKQALRKHGLLVTVAVAGWQDLGKTAYDAVDRVHLMSYDQAFPQATVAKSQTEIDRLIADGCPPSKLTLGVPFYGRNKERAARTYARLTSGRDVGPAIDEIDGFAFNGRDTIRAKVRLANDRKLAGVMIWELGHDTRDETSLLSAIAEQLAAQSSAGGTK